MSSQPPDDDYSLFLYRKAENPILRHHYLSTWGSRSIATDAGVVGYQQSLFIAEDGKYSLISNEWYQATQARTGVVSVVASGTWQVSRGVLVLNGLGTAKKNPAGELSDSLSLIVEDSLSDSLVRGRRYELVMVASNRGPSYYATSCAVWPSVKSLGECDYETCCRLLGK